MDDRHQSGHLAELYVAYRLAKNGYRIHFPSIAQSRYDLLIERGGVFIRVQVKKATWSQSSPHSYLQARIKSRNKGGKKYTKDEIDAFAFTDLDKVWLASVEWLEDYTSVCLAGDNPDYKSQKKYDPDNWLIPNT